MLARNIAGDDEALLAVLKEVASIPVDDGITLDTSQARSTAIREHAAYPGTRIVVPATLGTAQLQLRLDVNFGDPTEAQEIAYPTLLSGEPFGLLGYPVETVIAEKVETMISRGDANTRVRDYADVLALSKNHPIEFQTLRQALEQTALHRGTELVSLSEALETLPADRQQDWRAFLVRAGLPDMPESFEEAVEGVADFMDPVIRNAPDLLRWNPATGEWESRK